MTLKWAIFGRKFPFGANRLKHRLLRLYQSAQSPFPVALKAIEGGSATRSLRNLPDVPYAAQLAPLPEPPVANIGPRNLQIAPVAACGSPF